MHLLRNITTMPTKRGITIWMEYDTKLVTLSNDLLISLFTKKSPNKIAKDDNLNNQINATVSTNAPMSWQ